MRKDLGRVSMVNKGVYDNSSTYEKLDIVTYQGSCYLALTGCTGKSPLDSNYWIVVSKGAYAGACEHGYTDNEWNFYRELAAIQGAVEKVSDAGESAKSAASSASSAAASALTASTKLSSMEARISALPSGSTTMDAKVTKNTDDIAGLSTTVSNIQYAISGTNANINASNVQTICSNNLNLVPNNKVYGVSLTNTTGISNCPLSSIQGQLITIGKHSDRTNSDTQIFINYNDTGEKTVYYRIYWGNQWKSWNKVVNADDINDMVKVVLSPSALSAEQSVNKLLANISDSVCFAANAGYWTDLPNTEGGAFINFRYSENYFLQTIIEFSSNKSWNRIVNKNTHAVWRDWEQTTGSENKKILALGDSICYGWRNSNKGFVGDLGMPYKNIGVSSATLSTKVTDVNNIPQQLLDYNDTFVPDIIIANGGINDVINGAPLGIISEAPVATDTEAATLDRSTMIGGLEYLFYTMIKRFPSAQRFFVIVHKTMFYNRYLPTTKYPGGEFTQQQMHDTIVEVCKMYGVKVIDVYNEGIINTKFDQYKAPSTYSEDNSITNSYFVDKDGVHPLAYGYKHCYLPLVRQAIEIGTVK